VQITSYFNVVLNGLYCSVFCIFAHMFAKTYFFPFRFICFTRKNLEMFGNIGYCKHSFATGMKKSHSTLEIRIDKVLNSKSELWTV
jgi:hypothetical protein